MIKHFHFTCCHFSLDQVMAIATLSTCYNNPMVFQGVVKIRKGQAVTLMMEATNMSAVQTIIAQYSQEVGYFFIYLFILNSVSLYCLHHIGVLNVLSLSRYYTRCPSPTRLGKRRSTSWL